MGILPPPPRPLTSIDATWWQNRFMSHPLRCYSDKACKTRLIQKWRKLWCIKFDNYWPNISVFSCTVCLCCVFLFCFVDKASAIQTWNHCIGLPLYHLSIVLHAINIPNVKIPTISRKHPINFYWATTCPCATAHVRSVLNHPLVSTTVRLRLCHLFPRLCVGNTLVKRVLDQHVQTHK